MSKQNGFELLSTYDAQHGARLHHPHVGDVRATHLRRCDKWHGTLLHNLCVGAFVVALYTLYFRHLEACLTARPTQKWNSYYRYRVMEFTYIGLAIENKSDTSAGPLLPIGFNMVSSNGQLSNDKTLSYNKTDTRRSSQMFLLIVHRLG